MHDRISLEKVQNLTLGDHISCIYRSDDELFSFLIPFYISGLEQHNKCIFALGDEPRGDVMSRYLAAGVDLTPHIEKKEFNFFDAKDLYLVDGHFHEDAVFTAIQKEEEHALQEGYTGLRINGDGMWLGSHVSELSTFLKYEAKVSGFLEGHSVIGACLYKESIFDKHVLVDVLRTHSHVYLYDRLLDNKYFSATDNFIPQRDLQSSVFDYDRMIASLLSLP